jgi:hypothetical protein
MLKPAPGLTKVGARSLRDGANTRTDQSAGDGHHHGDGCGLFGADEQPRYKGAPELEGAMDRLDQRWLRAQTYAATASTCSLVSCAPPMAGMGLR